VPKTDSYETALLSAFESGTLKSVSTKAELAKFKAAARASAMNERIVNTRFSEQQAEPSLKYLN
jgi:hypothetical protein